MDSILKHSGILRVCAKVILVLGIFWMVSEGIYTVSKAAKERDTLYEQEYTNYEASASLWDAWVEENGEQVVIDAVGERPEEPVKQSILNDMYPTVSKVLLVTFVLLFMYSVLSAFSEVCAGIHLLLNGREAFMQELPETDVGKNKEKDSAILEFDELYGVTPDGEVLDKE